MVTEQRTSGVARNVVRSIIGLVLFIAWVCLTIIWVYSIIYALGEGHAGPLIRGICALLLMVLLGGMEGLEVAMIDRWSSLYPDRPSSELAAWLAARQLFVAAVACTATVLAEPDLLAFPFSSITIPPGSTLLKAFTIVWTAFTLLWWAQTTWKCVAATNTDRYLLRAKGLLPLVRAVAAIGCSVPAEFVSTVVARRLGWEATEGVATGTELESLPVSRGPTLASAWAALIPEAPAHVRRTPEDGAGA